MNDLISRKAAIEAVDKNRDTVFCNSVDYEGVLYDISNLPSAQPERRWIPCSERLPEDGQDVLFCDIDEDIMLGYHVKGRPDTHFTQCGSWDEIKNVFAWMPLPEPWRGEEHGQSRE